MNMKTSAYELGQLAKYRGKERKPALDKTFCKVHLEGKPVDEQRKALLDWLDGYDS